MFLGRRLIQMAAMLAFLSFALFALVHWMPGSTEDLLIQSNPRLSQEDVARIRALRSLDIPLGARYACWMIGRTPGLCDAWPSEQGILRGDLGWSSVHKLPVRDVLAIRLVRTLCLTLPAFILALILSTGLGVLAAVRPKSAIDRAVGLVTSLGLSLPTHWLAMISILVFAVLLGWFPPSGAEAARHAVLPIAVLCSVYVSRWTRYVRSRMLDVLELDFIRAARAKGLTERAVILGHALPNALFPLVTVAAQSIPGLFSGALIIERVFAYPGVGVLVFESVEANDYLVAAVVFLIYAALTMGASLLADALYFALDPRVRLGAREPAR